MTISWQSKFKAEVATLGPSTKSITGNYTAKDWTEVAPWPSADGKIGIAITFIVTSER